MQCKVRKVRCSGTTPACKACMRTARFEGRDPELVVCQYGGKKCGVRGGKKNKGKGKEVRVVMEDEQEHHSESTDEADFANERLGEFLSSVLAVRCFSVRRTDSPGLSPVRLQLDLRAALVPDSTSHPLYFPLPPSRAASTSSSSSERSSLSTSPSSYSSFSSTSSFPSLSIPQIGPTPAATYASQLPAQFDYTSFLSTFSPSQLPPPLPILPAASSTSPTSYPTHLPSIAIPSTGGSLFASSPSTVPSVLPSSHSPSYPLPTPFSHPASSLFSPSFLSPNFPSSFGTAGTYFGSPTSYFSPRAVVGNFGAPTSPRAVGMTGMTEGAEEGGAPLFGARTWEAVLGGEKEKEPWGWGGRAEGWGLGEEVW